MNNLPVFYANIAGESDGIFAISLVDFPAVEKNFVCFKEEKELVKFAVQNEEEHLLCGVVMAANQPIYRRNEDGFEYYIVYQPDTIKVMAQKMLADKTHNNINLQHNGEYIDGVELVELFIKDSQKGINPNYIEDVPDGSLMATYKVQNDEVWQSVKDGELNGFSLAGMFTVKQKYKSNKIKNTMSKLSKFVKSFLVKFAEITTDKGTLLYAGDEDIKVGDEVFVTGEDGEAVAAEDGDYTLEDGTVIVVAEGKVAEIKEAEVEEEKPVEENMAKQKFNKIKAEFEATYQEIQSNIYTAIEAMGIYGYIVENTSEYAIISTWGNDDKEHLYKYSISIAEDGTVTLGEMIEVETEYLPISAETVTTETATTVETEMSTDEETGTTEETKVEEEPEFDVKAEIEAIKAEIDTIKEKLAEIIEKPAVTPIAEEFSKVEVVTDRFAELAKLRKH